MGKTKTIMFAGNEGENILEAKCQAMSYITEVVTHFKLWLNKS